MRDKKAFFSFSLDFDVNTKKTERLELIMQITDEMLSFVVQFAVAAAWFTLFAGI